ncbi:MAG: DUF4011 domain-containing protein [Deltaproteobacteria bacterium]|jgi:hypothetical protein|nr:DUF4011 domain-containing protein [Deltaproteobacteria bacterium]
MSPNGGSPPGESLIYPKIDRLRRKLLDLSRSNPLISAKLNPRSNSLIRVVDERPEFLLKSLTSGANLTFKSLPPLEKEPEDEKTEPFLQALVVARNIDEEYILGLKIPSETQSAANLFNVTPALERALKDRTRLALAWPPREDESEVSLAKRALSYGINPDYDLPLPDEETRDEHLDRDIQTLFSPEDMDRKLWALLSKARLLEEETGVNALTAAFGFLEWVDNQKEVYYSPLILLSTRLTRKVTPKGPKYVVWADEEAADLNFALAEKARLEFGLELPNPPNDEKGVPALEEYFQKVTELIAPLNGWRLRRQVAFGLFPSSRMTMYLDLAEGNHDYQNLPLIHDIILGGSASLTLFAEDYLVDQPEIEAKIPGLVLDADSSQISTMVDVMEGRNLTVEGPPGTGKSQTIVNVIAAALAKGWSVLFVAEKQAALEVVKSRLEAVSLGEFLWPLQAGRSTRKLAIESLKARLEIKTAPPNPSYEVAKAKYSKNRALLAQYIDLIGAIYGQTGKTIEEIMGQAVLKAPLLDNGPEVFKRPQDLDLLKNLKPEDLKDLLKAADRVAQGFKAAKARPAWAGLTLTYLDPFQTDQFLGLAQKAGAAFSAVNQKRENGPRDLDDLTLREVFDFRAMVRGLKSQGQELNGPFLAAVLSQDLTPEVINFYNKVGHYQENAAFLARELSQPEDPAILGALKTLLDSGVAHNLATLDPANLAREIEVGRKELIKAQNLEASFKALGPLAEAVGAVPYTQLRAAQELIKDEDYPKLPSLRDLSDLTLDTIKVKNRQGLDLLARRAVLAERVDLETPLSPLELREVAGTVLKAGLLSFLSPTFRRAKRLVTSVAKNPKDLAQAAQDLAKLANYKEEVKAFVSDPAVKAAYGPLFSGLDTDFLGFNKALSFQEKFRATLGDEKSQDLKKALEVGSGPLVDFLKTNEFPAMEGDLTGLDAFNSRFAAKLDKGVALLAKIRDLITVIKPLGDLRAESLMKVAGALAFNQEFLAFLAGAPKLKDLPRLLDPHSPGPLPGELEALNYLASQPRLKPLAQSILAQGGLEAALGEMDQLFGLLERAKDELTKFNAATGLSLNFAGDSRQAAAGLAVLAQDREGLLAQVELAAGQKALEGLGFAWVVAALEDIDAAGFISQLTDLLEAAVYRGLGQGVYRDYGPKLAVYAGEALDTIRADFAAADREVISLYRDELKRTLASASVNAPEGVSRGTVAQLTEMGFISHELGKKRGFASIRELTRRAGQALLALKPCWMMSPLAVASYLPAGGLKFDLLVIDEASQMTPESALGALARSQRVMVVGDANQLPPTNFFKKALKSEETEEEERGLDDESILEVAAKIYRPGRRLRWHYRSRHPSLIQFSNRHIYDNELKVFMAPDNAAKGVSLVKTNGLYRSSVNPIEAAAMVKAATDLMRASPDLSLGLVTLNQKQMELIADKMYEAISEDEELAAYVSQWETKNDGLESFFVKNLESVQGDERDVIFIGTVYGPETPGGPVANRFGPINGLAGQRRLNVLFTRSKRRIVTFTSLEPGDIKATGTNPGASMLRDWLLYCESLGSNSLTDPPGSEEGGLLSLASQLLGENGYKVSPGLITGALGVDLAVSHPDLVDGFIIGLSTDGPNWRNVAGARDRDRLIDQVLKGLGWNLGRIWSTKWLSDPRLEGEKLLKTVNTSLSARKDQKY